MAEAEEDFKSLPLEDRFAHKNWKVRKEAYEDAAKEFRQSPNEASPVFRPFIQDSGLMKGAVADSNVAAQQEGLGALCAFLKEGPREAATRTRGVTVAPIVEKGLASTRAGVKQNALEALMLYVEVDKADPIVEELVPAFSNKQPKVVTATLWALTNLFHAFGVKIVDPKPVLKALGKPFGHADKNVRAEANSLTVELHRWLKDAMKTAFWNDLKPLQQQELEKLFEAVKSEPAPKQERLTRAQQEAAAVASENPQADEAEVEEEEGADDVVEVNAFDFSEPVDILNKLPPTFEERLASSKWKDRKDALEEFHTLANVPRLKEGHYDEVMASLAKCMKDANIMVVAIAGNCVEAIAKGLRRSFGKYRSRIMPPMFERLKEKKQSVADALGAALDAVFLSTSLSDCLEETLEFLKHKNPQVKLETLRFLIRCLKNTRDAPSMEETKLIADAATKSMTESTEVMRSGGAEILGTLMKIMGEKPMSPFFDGLDDIRKAKVKEYYDAAEVKAKLKPKKAPPPRKAAPPPQRKTVTKKPPAGLNAKKPAARPASPPQTVSPPRTAPKSASRATLGSKISGPSKSGLAAPSAGLKLQRKLPGPAGGATPILSSPRRNDPPATYEDDPAPPPAPRLGGLGGRGLAGRPLSKPTPSAANSSQTDSVNATTTTISSGLTAIERAELDELRLEKERWRQSNDDLRHKLGQHEVELNELRTHEAELIEERTRNRLTIKAKETQLVRARSDAEVAEETVTRQQREVERLKRELARSIRAMSPPPVTDVSDQIYRDVAGGGGAGGGGGGITVAGLDRYESNRASREIGYQRARSYMTSPSEEKENGGFGVDAAGAGAGGMGKSASPSRFTGAGAHARDRDVSESDSRASGSVGGRSSSATLAVDHSGGLSGNSNGEQPIESWRRAAEVTSQLKARIEQMKARQGLGRQH